MIYFALSLKILSMVFVNIPFSFLVNDTTSSSENSLSDENQLPKCINSKVLYKYKCGICINVYISKTKCHLIVSKYEHLGKSIVTDKPLRYSDKDVTAIRKHCQSSHEQLLSLK